jgi:two-component system sensor histidine kinase PilS (NtrC family)
MNPYDWARRICNEWSVQNGHSQALQADLPSDDISVRFDPEHLRRVLVNLLDNARRYATKAPDSIRVSGKILGPSHATLSVWSDGAAMDQSVERHLFEPFFSSESRSTGLGLYICRELCERHGASVVYQRSARGPAAQSSPGNAFVITLLRSPTGSHATTGALATTP